MCVILYKPVGVSIEAPILNQWIEVATTRNPNGSGFYYNGSIMKSIDNDKIIQAIKELKIRKKDLFVFHARIATYGDVIDENCHPFTYKGYTLFHNGVKLPCNIIKNKTDSESWLREIVPPIRKQKVFEVYDKLTKAGISNRILLIHKNKVVALSGDWKQIDGIYYSNLGSSILGGYKYDLFNLGAGKGTQVFFTREY